MNILKIDKETYRKKSNLVIVALVLSLAVLSIIFGSILIFFWGATPNVNTGSTGNFHLNAMGVILAIIVMIGISKKMHSHVYFDELMYVWKMKKIHTLIYRKFQKITSAAEKNNPDALLILAFYYTTQEQIFTLDNNTLTINSVRKSLNDIHVKAELIHLPLELNHFNVSLLDKF